MCLGGLRLDVPSVWKRLPYFLPTSPSSGYALLWAFQKWNEVENLSQILRKVHEDSRREGFSLDPRTRSLVFSFFGSHDSVRFWEKVLLPQLINFEGCEIFALAVEVLELSCIVIICWIVLKARSWWPSENFVLQRLRSVKHFLGKTFCFRSLSFV